MTRVALRGPGIVKIGLYHIHYSIDFEYSVSRFDKRIGTEKEILDQREILKRARRRAP